MSSEVGNNFLVLGAHSTSVVKQQTSESGVHSLETVVPLWNKTG